MELDANADVDLDYFREHRRSLVSASDVAAGPMDSANLPSATCPDVSLCAFPQVRQEDEATVRRPLFTSSDNLLQSARGKTSRDHEEAPLLQQDSPSSRGYKKKKRVSVDVLGPLPNDMMDIHRLGAMFHRYSCRYKHVMSSSDTRFSGLTEFVFAVLLHLQAEDDPVSLLQIYDRAKVLWNRLPEFLSLRFVHRDFKGSIRSSLYACQLFVRAPPSFGENIWTLRGRILPTSNCSDD